MNNLPPELQSISQPQPGGQDHNRFQQQRGRGKIFNCILFYIVNAI